MVNAGEIICCTSSMVIEGTWKAGNAEFNCPYTLPMVLTGSFAKYAMAVVTTIATKEPGILSVTFVQSSMMATAATPIRVAVRLILWIFFA